MTRAETVARAKVDLYKVSVERLTAAYSNEKHVDDVRKWYAARRAGAKLLTVDEVMRG